MITLGIILDKVGVDYHDIVVTSQLTMDRQLPPTIQSIVHSMRVYSSESSEKITALAHKAKAGCVIGRALSPDIHVSINVEVVSMSLVSRTLEEVSL